MCHDMGTQVCVCTDGLHHAEVDGQGTELWLSAAHRRDTCTQMHTWISNTSLLNHLQMQQLLAY